MIDRMRVLLCLLPLALANAAGTHLISGGEGLLSYHFHHLLTSGQECHDHFQHLMRSSSLDLGGFHPYP